MTHAAKQLHQLRKKPVASNTLDSIGIVDMAQCTDNPLKLDYHIRLDLAKHTGGPWRVVEEFGQNINVYVI